MGTEADERVLLADQRWDEKRVLYGAIGSWLFVAFVSFAVLAVGNFAHVTGGLSSSDGCWSLIRGGFWQAIAGQAAVALGAVGLTLAAKATPLWMRWRRALTIGVLAAMIGAGVAMLGLYVLALAGDTCSCTAATC